MLPQTPVAAPQTFATLRSPSIEHQQAQASSPSPNRAPRPDQLLYVICVEYNETPDAIEVTDYPLSRAIRTVEQAMRILRQNNAPGGGWEGQRIHVHVHRLDGTKENWGSIEEREGWEVVWADIFESALDEGVEDGDENADEGGLSSQDGVEGKGKGEGRDTCEDGGS